MKVLILCNDFPPLNSIGAQRPYSWYKHLHENGIEPIVITKNWKGHSATPQDVLRNAGDTNVIVERSNFGTIIRVPLATTPSERMLLKHGEHRYRLFRKATTFIYRLASFFSSRFDPHRNILKEANKFLTSNRVDGIIASGEPFLLFRYCYLLRRKFKLPWIADYRDGWKLNYVRRYQRDLLNRFLLGYESLFEKFYLRTASCITSVDPVLTEALSEQHNKPGEVIYNGFDGFYEGPRDEPSVSLPLLLNHVGTLTPGQRVEPFLQAVKELLEEENIKPHELKVQFIGLDYFPSQRNRVMNYNGLVVECITSTPRIARNDVLRMNSGADYQITFTEEVFKVINAKTYDYLAVKRPILVMPGDNSLLTKMISDLKAGESLNSVEDIKQFILNAIERKRNSLKIEPYPLDEKASLFYTRQQQTQRLSQVMRKFFTRS